MPMYGWYGALLGFASFPFGRMWLPWTDPDHLALDGVVLNYASVPGGSEPGALSCRPSFLPCFTAKHGRIWSSCWFGKC
jgi:hypothetical protein